ncbi:WapI family immunity protein [Rossellomorea sp. DUT-2]|uniref:WapI family immunity protein n=1 Tax=Rossellomorea sp. DUT-2 TaxID=3412021 RepID=UPI003D16601E
MKFHLLGEKAKIEIDVIGREYPISSDYWDGNWVVSNVKVEIPGYNVNFNASLRTDDIIDFVNDLKLMSRNLSGKAILKNLDSFIHFEGEMDKLGHIEWSGETCYPAGSGAVLTFEFVSNQSYLDVLIKELEDITYVYPVIGKP